MPEQGPATVLLLGATGLIGRHLKEVLTDEGFRVRTLSRAEYPELDFTAQPGIANWVSHLNGIHSVINAVGIFNESGRQTFKHIHDEGPRTLFDSCVVAGVRHVVQISALGAHTQITEYFRSKHRADEYLAQLPIPWTIVQPSLVYAPQGRSARFFNMLAALPVAALPEGGRQQVQPIHLSDVGAGVVRILRAAVSDRRIPFVGPAQTTLRLFLASLRAQLGLGSLRTLSIPPALSRLAARLGTLLRWEFLNVSSLQMLQAGSTGRADALTFLLQRPPLPIESFIPAGQRSAVASIAILAWCVPLLRVSIAAMWIWSGMTSLWFYPRELSYELLASTPLPANIHFPALVLGATIDMGLGAAVLLLYRKAWIWKVQIAVILAYTFIISIALPEFWLHPYGPVLKNLPVLAALVLLHSLEPRLWNTCS